MIAASCTTALGALCGQLTFLLVWCHEHSAVTATDLLQPLDLACRTLFWSSCAIQTSPQMTAEGTSFSGSMNAALTYSLTYLAMELHSYSMAEKKVKVVSYW